ncbi:MAG: PKD domain-containing protein [Magnetococcales bacterium]|nr:PKD domain-containing protein [Magnetococcales bacterium]
MWKAGVAMRLFVFFLVLIFPITVGAANSNWGSMIWGTDLWSDTATVEVEPLVIETVNAPEEIRVGNTASWSVALSSGHQEATYAWDFGDGTTSEQAEPTHSYANTGSYRITVQVTSGEEQAIFATTHTVLESRFAIHGTLYGLNAGSAVTLIATAPDVEAGQYSVVVGSSDDAQAFSIDTLVPAENYTVQLLSDTQPDGYWHADEEGSLDGALGLFTQATKLDLSEGDVSGLNIHVQQGRTLTATLSGFIEGDQATVDVWSKSEGGFVQSSGTADSSGILTLTLEGVPETSDILVLCTPGEQTGLFGGFYVSDTQPLSNAHGATLLDLSQKDSQIALQLSNGHIVSGTIYNPSIDDALYLTLWSPSTGEGDSMTLWPDGDSVDFKFKSVPVATDYRLCIESQNRLDGCYAGSGSDALQPFHLAPPLSAGDVDQISINLESGASIEGQVLGLDDNQRAWVDLYSPSAEIGDQVKTDAQGYFHFNALARHADYQLSVHADQKSAPEVQTVDLTQEESAWIELNLSSGQTLTGTLYGLTSGDSLLLQARNVTTGDIQEVSLWSTDTTMPFSIAGLAADEGYILSIQKGQSGFYYYHPDGLVHTLSQASTITIQKDSSPSLILNLSDDGSNHYSISGTISGLEESDSHKMVSFTLWNDQGHYQVSQRQGAGDFSLSAIPEGSYTLWVQAEGFQDQFWSDSGWQTAHQAATELTLTADYTELDITLVSGWSIKGAVTYNGATQSHVAVMAWDSENGTGTQGWSLSDGSFELSGLASGSYRLEARQTDGAYAVLNPLILADSVDAIALDLEKSDGLLTVTVQGSLGSQALLTVFDQNGAYVSSSVPDAFGQFTVDGLEEGALYSLTVNNDDDFSTHEGETEVTIQGETALVMIVEDGV